MHRTHALRYGASNGAQNSGRSLDPAVGKPCGDG